MTANIKRYISKLHMLPIRSPCMLLARGGPTAAPAAPSAFLVTSKIAFPKSKPSNAQIIESPNRYQYMHYSQCRPNNRLTLPPWRSTWIFAITTSPWLPIAPGRQPRHLERLQVLAVASGPCHSEAYESTPQSENKQKQSSMRAGA